MPDAKFGISTGSRNLLWALFHLSAFRLMWANFERPEKLGL
jgi:hypothetical protein